MPVGESTVLAKSFRFRSRGRMQFVIIDTAGKPLADNAGMLILLGTRDEARRWLARGERVEPYVPKLHDATKIEALASGKVQNRQ